MLLQNNVTQKRYKKTLKRDGIKPGIKGFIAICHTVTL